MSEIKVRGKGVSEFLSEVTMEPSDIGVNMELQVGRNSAHKGDEGDVHSGDRS